MRWLLSPESCLLTPYVTISSPPSTRITFPVNQWVLSLINAEIAWATSSGVVSRPPGLRSRANSASFSMPGILPEAAVIVIPGLDGISRDSMRHEFVGKLANVRFHHRLGG